VQPSVRAAWNPVPALTAWAAVSRAVRVPTRLERDIAIDVSNPLGNPVLRLLGNRDFAAERLLAYEAGYRWQALKSLWMDIALFLDRYEGLASLEAGRPFVDPQVSRTIIPIQNYNLNAGRGRGGEALITYSPAPRARLSASYSNLDVEITPGGQDLNRGVFLDGAIPRHQFGLRSAIDLPARLQADALLRHLSSVRRFPQDPTGGGIPAYSELDVRIAWNGWRRAEISLIGQNLLHDHHKEFGAPAARGEIERGVYAKFAWGY
jgi:iron complex outermembrane recepter protein